MVPERENYFIRKIVGRLVIGEGGELSESIDLVLAYKLLKFIYEHRNEELGIKEIAVKGKFSSGTTDKYIHILSQMGFVEIKRVGRKKIPVITEKGIEYLLLMERIMSLLRR